VVWKDLEPAVLIACDTALSHLSEEGFVYYIPAYLRLAMNQLGVAADPEWEAFGSTIFIDLLRQIRAAGGFEGKMAEEALDAYWGTPEARRRTILHVP